MAKRKRIFIPIFKKPFRLRIQNHISKCPFHRKNAPLSKMLHSNENCMSPSSELVTKWMPFELPQVTQEGKRADMPPIKSSTLALRQKHELRLCAGEIEHSPIINKHAHNDSMRKSKLQATSYIYEISDICICLSVH